MTSGAFGKARKVADLSVIPKRQTLGKHRYLMPLDDAMRAQIAPLARPYPKRAKHPGDAAAVQAVEGGSTPTRTLQMAHAT